MRPLHDAAGNRHPGKERDTYLGRKLVLGSLPQAGTTSSGDGPDQPTIIAGSLTVQTDQAVTERYAFDAQNRLKAVTRDDIWLASSLADNYQNFRQADHITVAGYGSTPFKLEQRRYDALGQLLEVEAEEAIANDTIRLIYGLADPNQLKGNAMPGIGDERLRYQYDKLGRMQRQSTWGSDWKFSSTVSYQNEGGTGVRRGGDQSDKVSSALPDKTPNGYDLAGNVLQYTVFNASGPASTFRMDYVWRDGALLTTTTGYRDKAPRPGVTLKTYDGNGHIRSVIDPNDTRSDITRQFNTDANGTVLRSVQVGQEVPSYLQVGADGKPLPPVRSNAGDLTANEQFQLVAAGQVLGRYGEMVNPDAPRNKDNNLQFIADQDFNFVFKSVNDGAAQGTSTYTVVKGDTLQSIAKAQLGDADLWFTIAQANGLADSAGLEEGQVLRIPAVIVTSTNNDDGTFEAYDPTAVIGDTTPIIPQPPQKKTKWYKKLIVVIVQAAVTVFTGGNAFLGNVAGQLTGRLLGIQDSFNWRSLAASAFMTYVGGGPVNVSNTGVPIVDVAINAAANNFIQQGVNVAFGAQKRFSWRAVAASAITAGVTQGVGEAIGGANWQNSASLSDFGKFAIDAGSRFIGGTVAQAVTNKGGRVNFGQVAADAFGNALGNSIVGQINQASQQEQRAGFIRAGASAMDAEFGIHGQPQTWQSGPRSLPSAAVNLDDVEFIKSVQATEQQKAEEDWARATRPLAVAGSMNGVDMANYRLNPRGVVAGATQGLTSLLTSSQYGLTADLSSVQQTQAANERDIGLASLNTSWRSVADDPATRGALMGLAADYFGQDGVRQRNLAGQVALAAGVIKAGDPTNVAEAANLATALGSLRRNPFAVALLSATLADSRDSVTAAVNHLADSSALEYNGGRAWNFATARDIASGTLGGLVPLVGVGSRAISRAWTDLNRSIPDISGNPFLADRALSVGSPVRLGVSGQIKWVDENAGMSKAAREYNDSATGARSNQAPAIQRTLPDGTGRLVKFDGVDIVGDELIDRKLSVVTTPKAKDQALRQSEALRENRLQGRWEVTSEQQALRAQRMFQELGINNITVKVVHGPNSR